MKPITSLLCNKINQQLIDFDLLTLMRVLKSKGYMESSIWFASNNSLTSQERIIERVTLSDTRARVILNLGLLSVSGSLPNYIRKIFERPSINEGSFMRFIAFFDHLIIRDYLAQIYPEINKDYFPNWEYTKQDYIQLQNLHSECGLFWLFQQVFPEFSIHLSQKQLIRHCITKALHLGRIHLGNTDTFGRQGKTNCHGFQISLVIQQPDEHTDTSWISEVKRRLDMLIFPCLNHLYLSLDIKLCIGSHPHYLQLKPNSELGNDRFLGYETHSSWVRVFYGLVNFDSQIIFREEDTTEWGSTCRIQV